MKFEEIKAKWTGRKLGFCTLETKQVNRTGTHPFCVGAEHVAYASEHNGGMLTESVCRKIPCAALTDGWLVKCGRDPDDPVHASIVVLYVHVAEPCTQKDIAGDLCSVKAEAAADGVDGFAFPDTSKITDWGSRT